VDAQGQKLDDLTDRLRRGLAGRADKARAALSQSGGGLRPALLQRHVMTLRRDLARVPDMRALVMRRHGDAAQRLELLSRVLPQLNPYAPLDRGYAVVSAPDGHAVTSREAAAKQPVLTLRFRDGTLDVATGSSPPPARRRKSGPDEPGSGQQSLF